MVSRSPRGIKRAQAFAQAVISLRPVILNNTRVPTYALKSAILSFK